MEDLEQRIEQLRSLTPREREVLQRLCEDFTHKQIGAALSITERTVVEHVRNIHRKLEIDQLRGRARDRALQRFCPALSALLDNGVTPRQAEAAHAEVTRSADLVPTASDSESEVEDDLREAGSEDTRAVNREPPVRRLPVRSLVTTTTAVGFLLVLGYLIYRSGWVLLFPDPIASVAVACGNAGHALDQKVNRFVRHEGVSAFSIASTNRAVLNDRVRSVHVHLGGLWVGYATAERSSPLGLSHYDRQTWTDCTDASGLAGQVVNAIVTDHSGRLWIATETSGVTMFDGTGWRRFTTLDGLPSERTYSLAIDGKNHAWVGTWEGVARFDGQRWSTLYTVENQTVFNNHVHAIAFASAGSIWVGHVSDGLSQYVQSERKWIYHTPDTTGFGGTEVRGIVVRPATQTASESVWVATEDGGVSKLEDGTWTVYRSADGLPSDHVRAVAVDRYGRVWAATSGGTAYFDGAGWNLYHSLDTLSISFGPSCQDCATDDEHVWTGTANSGLTHSRIPLARDPIEVVGVVHPQVLAPGQTFLPQITVRVRPPCQPREPCGLHQSAGDMLVSVDERDELRFGAWTHIEVKGDVEPGQFYTFVDHDNPLRAPELPPGMQELTFTSTWRVWMRTRYVGPPIQITFTVRRP